MNSNHFLAKKLYQESVFVDGLRNSIDAYSVKDEFREGRPKSVVTPENIDSVCELILQDRHVRLSQPWGVSGINITEKMQWTSVHSTLLEHLVIIKI